MIFISAGFDAAVNDPIGKCQVTNDCFAYMTKRLKDLNKKLLFVLEGGYNIDSL